MKHRLLPLICFIGCAAFSSAQLPADYRSEQIFLAPLQTAVMQGDTIDVEGIVTSIAADNVRPYSRYVYVELIGNADTALVRSKVACNPDATFSTRIPTDPLDPRGVYYLRAYTNLMRNFNPESFAVQPVLIGRNLPSDDGIVDENAVLAVYPTAGATVAGRTESIVAYLSSGQGFPLAGRKVAVVNSKGDVVTEATTSPSGLAALSFIPRPGETYSARFTDMGVTKTTPIEVSPAETPQVEGALAEGKIVFNIDGDIAGKRLMVFDRLNGLSEAAIQSNQGVISLPLTPTVATLFLTDADGSPIAQTTVSARELSVDAPLPFTIPDEITAGSPLPLGGLNADSTLVISTRLLQADDLISSHAEQALLYESDYYSPLPFPQRLYTSDARTRNDDLRTWLSTVTFKRFDLKELLDMSDAQVYAYLPETAMEIRGQVVKGKDNPFRGGRIVAYNATNNCTYDTIVGFDGRFAIAVDNFPDGTEFFLQPINTKGSPSRAEVNIDDDTYPAAAITRSALPADTRYLGADVSIEKNDALNARELANIVVKAHVKSEPRSTQQYYATRYKDREEIDRKGYLNLRDIVRDMPFLSLRRTNEGDVVLSKRANSLGNKGALIPFMVDGVLFQPGEYAMLLDMSTDDIESVEHLNPVEAIAYTNQSINGLVNVVTRNRSTSLPAPTKGVIVTPTGLNPDKVASPQHIAPSTPGRYRAAVDVVDSNGNVHSYEKWVTVK